jgi:hypothetical protein
MDEPRIPLWFTPLRMLLIFTSMSLVVYLDRGVHSSADTQARAKSVCLRKDRTTGSHKDSDLPAVCSVDVLIVSAHSRCFGLHLRSWSCSRPWRTLGQRLPSLVDEARACAWTILLATRAGLIASTPVNGDIASHGRTGDGIRVCACLLKRRTDQ